MRNVKKMEYKGVFLRDVDLKRAASRSRRLDPVVPSPHAHTPWQGFILCFGPEEFTFLYNMWTDFVTASFAMSIAQSIPIHLGSSFFGYKLLALEGNNGNFVYDVSRRVIV